MSYKDKIYEKKATSFYGISTYVTSIKQKNKFNP